VVLAARPEKVAVVDDPVIIAPPGLAVTVHGAEGNPLNITAPVAEIQVGCVTVPTIGAEGMIGGAKMVTVADGKEVHPDKARVTVKV